MTEKERLISRLQFLDQNLFHAQRNPGVYPSLPIWELRKHLSFLEFLWEKRNPSTTGNYNYF